MQIAEQLGMLKAAEGDPAQLALLAVDFAYPALPEVERISLKETLKAVAIPHWCDQKILAALLQIPASEAAERLLLLYKLNVVELFPARGLTAINVHETTRLVLRQEMRQKQSEYFCELSMHAASFFSASCHENSLHTASLIEWSYHLLAAYPELWMRHRGAARWLRRDPENRRALASILEELERCEMLPQNILAEIHLRLSRLELDEALMEVRVVDLDLPFSSTKRRA
ncbi:hypothetical protein [Nitrosospira sp. Is2]|uniref:hypothetical protein n=1 Tax=Nitrosospira sp. Is2 TaxID=3080532 RepID=UPI002952F50C|nr:hypothetical protein [Nitrosospira sp. Is2]WON74171.1 hypothetical protein R5L00_01385 [Nitrosospira sp. Is2]